MMDNLDEDTRVRKLNKLFHAEQASVYDDTHNFHPMAADIFRMRVKESDKVLDLGTGTGFVRRIVPSEDVIGIDLSRQMLKEGGKDGSMLIEGIVGQIPLKSNSVDVITGRSVLHHFPNLNRVASECLRVLRPGGELVIANEPKGMSFINRFSKRFKSRVGSLLVKKSDWKHELAEEFQTHVWDFTQTVNYHHETGVDPEPFDDRLDRIARVEYGDEKLAFIWRHE